MKIPHQDTLKRWLQTHDTPVFVQFVKYGLCGVASTIILLAITMALSNTMIPAMDWSTIEGQPITDAQRQRNLIINNLIAFPFANQVSYLLNARLVFVPGRPPGRTIPHPVVRTSQRPRPVHADWHLGPREFSLSQVPRLRPIVALQTAFVRLPSPP